MEPGAPQAASPVQAGVPPGRAPAPGALELVRRFINSRSLDAATDELDTPEKLSAWLAAQSLLAVGTAVSARDVGHALEVRETLRAFGARNNGIDCDCDVATLETAAERGGLQPVFEAGGASGFRAAAGGVDGALGTLLAIVHGAIRDGTWARLKACADPACAWAYYDRSKNGCSRWCTADVCGNRDKVKRYRERRALERSVPAP